MWWHAPIGFEHLGENFSWDAEYYSAPLGSSGSPPAHIGRARLGAPVRVVPGALVSLPHLGYTTAYTHIYPSTLGFSPTS